MNSATQPDETIVVQRGSPFSALIRHVPIHQRPFQTTMTVVSPTTTTSAHTASITMASAPHLNTQIAAWAAGSNRIDVLSIKVGFFPTCADFQYRVNVALIGDQTGAQTSMNAHIELPGSRFRIGAPLARGGMTPEMTFDPVGDYSVGYSPWWYPSMPTLPHPVVDAFVYVLMGTPVQAQQTLGIFRIEYLVERS